MADVVRRLHRLRPFPCTPRYARIMIPDSVADQDPCGLRQRDNAAFAFQTPPDDCVPLAVGQCKLTAPFDGSKLPARDHHKRSPPCAEHVGEIVTRHLEMAILIAHSGGEDGYFTGVC